MLLNHNSKIYDSKPNIDNIEAFLEKEKEANKKKPWSKLSKASKLKKISESIKFQGYNIQKFSEMTISNLSKFISSINLKNNEEKVASKIFNEIKSRLKLEQVLLLDMFHQRSFLLRTFQEQSQVR